jgi:peptide/nickel transport system substrate-binding protein
LPFVVSIPLATCFWILHESGATSNHDLRYLGDISAEDIAALNALAIYSIDDFERYTRTSAMLSELSRKAKVPEIQLRRWRKLPYLVEVIPTWGEPGSYVRVRGGNFGSYPDTNAALFFQGRQTRIAGWSDEMIEIVMPPEVKGKGILFALIGGQATNPLDWESRYYNEPA